MDVRRWGDHPARNRLLTSPQPHALVAAEDNRAHSHTTYRTGGIIREAVRVVALAGTLAGIMAAIGAAATGGSTGIPPGKFPR